jgi:hypothetical protein
MDESKMEILEADEDKTPPMQERTTTKYMTKYGGPRHRDAQGFPFTRNLLGMTRQTLTKTIQQIAVQLASPHLGAGIHWVLHHPPAGSVLAQGLTRGPIKPNRGIPVPFALHV